MSANICILIFGRDRLLLQTREWLLEAAGYRVVLAQTLAEVDEIVSKQHVQMLVLCHTVSVKDGEDALAVVTAHCPHVKCLVLAEESKQKIASCAETLPMMSGPQSFISKIQTLVGGEVPSHLQSSRL
jgi:DNA-binding NtrC family response regulator